MTTNTDAGPPLAELRARAVARHLDIRDQTRARYEAIRVGPHLQLAVESLERMDADERSAATAEFSSAGGDPANADDFHLFCVVKAHDELAYLLGRLSADFVPFRTDHPIVRVAGDGTYEVVFTREQLHRLAPMLGIPTEGETR